MVLMENIQYQKNLNATLIPSQKNSHLFIFLTLIRAIRGQFFPTTSPIPKLRRKR